MKKRNLAAVFGLSIITLGIYDLYWLVKTKKELNVKTKVHTPTIWLLFLPIILLIVVVIVALVSGHNNTTNQAVQYSANGTPLNSNGTAAVNIVGILVGFIAVIIILPITFYWFFRFSKAVNEYTNGKMSTGITFLLLYLLHLIGVVLVQDTFNDMIAAGTEPGLAGPAPLVNTVNMNQVSPAQPQPLAPEPRQTPPQPQQFATNSEPSQPQTQSPPAQPFSDVVPPTAPVGTPTIIQPNQDNNGRPLIQ